MNSPPRCMAAGSSRRLPCWDTSFVWTSSSAIPARANCCWSMLPTGVSADSPERLLLSVLHEFWRNPPRDLLSCLRPSLRQLPRSMPLRMSKPSTGTACAL
jgi:hypothetical protein